MLLSTSKDSMVSVILPAYNAEKYICDSVDSILRQTYKNFELIVINDGSTDNTQAQLDKYKMRSDVKIIERANKGIVATLNEAVACSEGTYIMRMDADDVSMPGRMEKQLAILKAKELDIVGSAIKTFGNVCNFKRKYFEEDDKMKFQLLFASCFAHPTILCKKEVLSNNPYSSEYEKIEDYALWTKLATGNYKMGNCGDVLLRYRVHKKQITSDSREYQDQRRIEIAKAYNNHYFSSPAFSEAIEVLLKRDFQDLNEERVKALNGYYDFLMKTYKSYADIINYHFFICYMHNYFSGVGDTMFFEQMSFVKRNFLLAFNKTQFLKELPVKMYRKLF